MATKVLQNFSTRGVVLHLLAVWSFACAQPLYDLFGRYPTFLVAHGLAETALLGYVFCLSVVLPAVLFAPLMLLQKWQTAVAGVIAAGLLALLLWLVVLPLPWSFWPDLRLRYGLLLSLVLTVGVLVLYAMQARVREGFSFLGFAIIAFPLLFLLQGAVKGLLLPKPIGEAQAAVPVAGATITELPDLMLVVFDELPLTALLNANGLIDNERFPNFARLAAASDFYTAATTVAARTQAAVPAILTGRLPTIKAQPPDANAHPQNLFSLLRGFYELDVVESVTQLCREQVGGDESNCTHARRDWREVVLDSAIVLAHRVTPPQLRVRLPTIGENWGGFLVGQQSTVAGATNPVLVHAARLRGFIDRIEPGTAPRLSFLHSELPHAPYILLPQGEQLFRHRSTAKFEVGGNTDVLADASYGATEALQFFRWQLGFVDAQLGALLSRLRATDRFDRTLLMVTADHGVSLQPGRSRREPAPDTLRDILSVPLFIKRAGQTAPRRIDHPIQTIDLVPTILAELGLRAPEQVDGIAYGGGGDGSVTYVRSFVNGRSISHPPNDLKQLAAQPWWTDANPVALASAALPSAEALRASRCAMTPRPTLLRPELYDKVRPDRFLPAHALIENVGAHAHLLYVRFNGTVHAVYPTGADDASAFLDPGLFGEGHNQIELISRQNDDWCLLYDNAAAHEIRAGHHDARR